MKGSRLKNIFILFFLLFTLTSGIEIFFRKFTPQIVEGVGFEKHFLHNVSLLQVEGVG